MKYVIGLTGRIASGKSSVSRMLQQKGAYIIDADSVAHEVIRQGFPAYFKIVEYFGKDFLDASGEIDRRKIGRHVFACAPELLKLNQIVHPYVIEEINERLSRSGGIVVIDAVFLKEAGLDACCNEVWVIEAPKEERLKRIMNRDGLSREAALARMRAQPENDALYAVPVYRLDNSSDMVALDRQVSILWKCVEDQCQSEEKKY